MSDYRNRNRGLGATAPVVFANPTACQPQPLARGQTWPGELRIHSPIPTLKFATNPTRRPTPTPPHRPTPPPSIPQVLRYFQAVQPASPLAQPHTLNPAIRPRKDSQPSTARFPSSHPTGPADRGLGAQSPAHRPQAPSPRSCAKARTPAPSSHTPCPCASPHASQPRVLTRANLGEQETIAPTSQFPCTTTRPAPPHAIPAVPS
jgi:hypothetical protein